MDVQLSELEMLEWQPQADDGHMMVDEDYMSLMTDTLFSTISANQPFAFPDTREIGEWTVLLSVAVPYIILNVNVSQTCSPQIWISRLFWELGRTKLRYINILWRLRFKLVKSRFSNSLYSNSKVQWALFWLDGLLDNNY